MYKVLYEDNDFFIIDKKSGIAVHSGSKVKFNLIDSLNKKNPAKEIGPGPNLPSQNLLAEKANTPSFYLLHRLDKETAGVLVLAKKPVTSKTLNQFTLEKKIYWAVVKGKFSRKKIWVNFPLEVKGRLKASQSKIVVKKEFANFSLLEIELGSGRFHQIRKQLETMGHPIGGDKKYGDFNFNKKKKLSNLYLFAKSIELRIKNKKPIKVKAALPQHFVTIFNKYNILV